MPFTLYPEDAPSIEIPIKKSRFIARLRYADGEKPVAELLSFAREVDRNANHHCYAYILGFDPTARTERSSDDGEPGSTAGAPILRTLKAHDLCNVVLVVSRYFGGVKLGAGGLTRAYARAASSAIELANLRPLVRTNIFELVASHAAAGKLEAELRGRGFEVTDVRHGESVQMTVLSPDGVALAAAVNDISSGTIDLVPMGHVWK
ncbi:YigZ family protein [Mycolicibacterium sp. F2034L]|uniref:IMPACT family protein n=1 Tax=Mycolicibacterium sp. F2034L TaxID=2926422 RepID=UPI001FF6AC8D|nr:YigZ family protein [Mycolicibacterium sp. F2034L]MCK0174683.1 YigZ family protein [Mycolicibacterium sp. F2034L]